MSAEASDSLPTIHYPRRQRALLRKAIWEAHAGICGICGRAVGFLEMQIDHVVPVSLGGSNKRDNLQPSHLKCNVAKGGRNRGLTVVPNAPRPEITEWPVVDDGTLRAWVDRGKESPGFYVPNMDPLLWQRIVREARLHDLSAGALLSVIVGEWLDEHQCASTIGPLEPAERDN